MTTKSGPVRSFTTSVDIPAGTRTKVNGILDQHLADSFDLMSQDKQAHWNVKGSDFWQLHKLFDEVAALGGGPVWYAFRAGSAVPHVEPATS